MVAPLPPVLAEEAIDLGLPGGVGQRRLTSAFPGKTGMILQRTRPPLLETPMQVFDKEIITPNDRAYVRWHWADIPLDIDADAFRLAIRGQVNSPLRLTLSDLLRMPSLDYVAVNQCSGNSRGFVEPRVPGAQWANGSMSNSRWTGVPLRHILDRAGLRRGALFVRFAGLDEPLMPDAPDFRKSLSVDHARDGEVMVAYAMNGEQLPLLNGFPLRLVVPGWYATYWVKMLSDIEVLDRPDENYWTTKAYLVPDNPAATMTPGETVTMVPIGAMVPRAFITNMTGDRTLPAHTPLTLRGIALGGDCGVSKVEVSTDAGASWRLAHLGSDLGRYSFRRWQSAITLPPGRAAVMVRCTNERGLSQPLTANWNPSGFMRNSVETLHLIVA